MHLYEFERSKNVALFNEKLILIGKIERKYPQSDIQKWAEKKLKQGKNMYKNKKQLFNYNINKYRLNSNIHPVYNNPPSYDALYGNSLPTIPTIPPPPYESYDDYMKRKKGDKIKN